MATAVAEKPSTLEAELEHWAVEGLRENLDLLDGDELSSALMLHAEGQDHLFEGWPAPGKDDEGKHRFFAQVAKLDSSYPGGLSAYIQNARQLLVDSRDGKNPFQGFTPSVPTGDKLQFGDASYDAYEQEGVKEAWRSVFVLVAGGLGERLGYSGIKVALPSETTTGKCFLQLYIESILALQDASHKIRVAAEAGVEKKLVPLVIMTSDDTHGRTVELLEKNSYFGMAKTQIHLLKQEKVACLSDNNATLAREPKDIFAIQTKPHGHGDVHMLLHTSGLLGQWSSEGTAKWVIFFQDTNGLVFKAVPASLGVSSVRDFDVNSLTVPRRAKEAVGAITRLTHSDGRTMVINVEYNQLDPLLRATKGYEEGDVNDASGYSPFPGNLNQLVLKLGPYVEELNRTGGLITEFVNPKYKDATKTVFKSATRLECMMQDYPKTLPPTAKVGFTLCDVWLGYSPVKNNAADAAAKVAGGTPPHSATSGEMDIYAANAKILKTAGADIAEPVSKEFNKQTVEVGPRIVWSPQWAITLAEVKAKVQKLKVSQKSVLVLEGADIHVNDVTVDGALVVKAAADAKVILSGLNVANAGWELVPVDSEDPAVPEEIRIRGFKTSPVETAEVVRTEAGEQLVSAA
eukprot:TRINITY_DN947_c0_g2_i1.p1 TRINITY_DN947_c0_g2~~TRINITY_DN947_c0_g2_i1.p1  ORF type:complete len:631 (-),score=144.25 TRINITY_DN947_c0_g2_i1:449-2341(-)